MHTRHFYVIIFLAVLAVAGYLIIRPSVSPAGLSKIEDPTSYAWSLTPGTPDAYGTPQTAISLMVHGKSYIAGNYTGQCRTLSPNQTGIESEYPDKNEITRVQCWWAGSGDEIGVFIENNKAVLKSGELSEGDPESQAFRGNFRTLSSL